MYKKILIVALILFSAIAIYYRNSVFIRVDYETEVNKFQVMTFKVEIIKNYKNIKADKVSINFYNKYKKDEKIDFELKATENNQYFFSYYPQYSGEYIGTVTISRDGTEISKKIDFKVSE